MSKAILHLVILRHFLMTHLYLKSCRGQNPWAKDNNQADQAVSVKNKGMKAESLGICDLLDTAQAKKFKPYPMQAPSLLSFPARHLQCVSHYHIHGCSHKASILGLYDLCRTEPSESKPHLWESIQRKILEGLSLNLHNGLDSGF